MDAHQRVLDFLRAHHVMTLATAGPSGPAAAAVFYASWGLDLCFLSAPHSLHCRNLQADARVAATIQDDCDQWSMVKGLQLIGTARMLDGAERHEASTRYAGKFRDVPISGGATGALARALRKICWYQLSVAQLRLIDNSRGFGHRDEWTRAEFLTAAPMSC